MKRKKCKKVNLEEKLFRKGNNEQEEAVKNKSKMGTKERGIALNDLVIMIIVFLIMVGVALGMMYLWKNGLSQTIQKAIDRSKLKIGDEVEYTPKTDQSSYFLTQDKSGYWEDQTINQESYKWKIMNKEKDGTVEIMGAPQSSKQEIYLRGPTGYNNGVYLLNDICKTLYSNNEFEVTARSINLGDIDKHMNKTGKTAKDENNESRTYGDIKTYSGENAWYPNLAEYESDIGINKNDLNTNGIGENDDGSTLEGGEITIPLLEGNTGSHWSR